MGSYASKLLARYGDEVTEPKAKSRPEESAPFTPLEKKKTLAIDPRSATVGIPRTPIEVKSTPPNTGRRIVSALPPYLQKKPYLETDLDSIGYLAPKKGSPSIVFRASVPASPVSYNEPPNTPKCEVPTIDVVDLSPLALGEHKDGDTPLDELRYKILGIDPRSPAANFDRTPILAPKSMMRFKARSHENLTRRDSCFELGLTEQTRLSFCETTTLGNIPEVLALPAITAKLNQAQEIDTTTENSDQFDSCSSSSSSESSAEIISDSGEEITVIPNPNVQLMRDSLAQNITTSFGSSTDRVKESDDVFYPTDNVNRVLSIATRAADKQQSVSDVERKITVWRDSISSEISETEVIHPVIEDSASMQSGATPLPKEEVMIEFDDAEITNTVKIQPTKKEEGIGQAKAKKEELAERKIKNVEADSKVYIQEKIFTPDGKSISKVPKVRTPLGNRSMNHGKVNNMPMKSPQQLLRAKAMSTKIHQENTPPRSMKSKLNSTQWDPDSTILI